MASIAWAMPQRYSYGLCSHGVDCFEPCPSAWPPGPRRRKGKQGGCENHPVDLDGALDGAPKLNSEACPSDLSAPGDKQATSPSADTKAFAPAKTVGSARTKAKWVRTPQSATPKKSTSRFWELFCFFFCSRRRPIFLDQKSKVCCQK